jgi:hypothetical protein
MQSRRKDMSQDGGDTRSESTAQDSRPKLRMIRYSVNGKDGGYILARDPDRAMVMLLEWFDRRW